MSEHTKGPWEVRKGAGWYIARPEAISRRDSAIAVGMTPATTLVCSPDRWFDDAEAKANAYVMAAAPELLEALMALRSFMWSEGYADQTAEMAQADAAILKSEGRA